MESEPAMSEAKKDLDITPEELNKIGNALKDEQFRKLFFDYCQEISDPENKAKYELEIQQLEKERGFDVTFVKPEAGHVIKAIDTTNNGKVFINVCTNSNVEDAKVGKQKKSDGKKLVNGENWTVPHILNPPRTDVDKAGKECRVCDVMFNPNVYAKAMMHKDMMKMLNNIALDSAEDKFRFKLDRNNVKYPKLKYKGRAEATLLRNKDSSNPDAKVDEHLSKFVQYPEVATTSNIGNNPPNKTLSDKENGKVTDDSKTAKENSKTVPLYKIIHRGHFNMQDYTMARSGVVSTRPAELCIEIELPAIKSANGVDLDIVEKKLILNSEKPSYHLEINLPYPVDDDRGTAMFDKSKRNLIVTLPVVKGALDVEEEASEEAAVEENGGFHLAREANGVDHSLRGENETSKKEEYAPESVVSPSLEKEEEAACSSENTVSADSTSLLVNGSRDQHKSDCLQETASSVSEFPLEESEEFSKQNTLEAKSADLPSNEDGHRYANATNGDAVASSVERTLNSKAHQMSGKLEERDFVNEVMHCPEYKKCDSGEEALSTPLSDQVLLTDRESCENTELSGIKRDVDNFCTNMSRKIGSDDKLCDKLTDTVSNVEDGMDYVDDKCTDRAKSDDEIMRCASLISSPSVASPESSEQIHLCRDVSKDCIEIDSEGTVKELQDRGRNSGEDVHGDVLCSENAKAERCLPSKDDVNQCFVEMNPVFDGAEDRCVSEENEGFSREDCTKLFDEADHSGLFENLTEDEIEMNFNLDGLADLSGMNQLPPHDFDQDEQLVTVNVNLADVKIEDISLGFSSRKAYFSMMSASENGDPVRWCLLIKFMEYCRLDKDLCSVDVEKDRVVLTLPKSEASYGLWHRILIGTSENTLQEMFFTTDHSMSELLSRLHQEENPWAKAAVDSVPAQCEDGSEAVAQKLEQLLREQELTFSDDSSTVVDQTGENIQENSMLYNGSEDTDVDDKNMFKFRKENKKKSRKETTSSSSDITVDVTLDELQNDVILEGASPVAATKGLSRLPVERSVSDESALGCNTPLRSILKRSQSESSNSVYGHNVFSGDGNCSSMLTTLSNTRIRSQSLNVDSLTRPWDRGSRYRNKSVSFDPEPQVCEFVEYSKKQLKKMRKQERKQTEIAAKKIEAAAKKSAGKNKGCKGGKNMHFFNGFKKDSSNELDAEKEIPNEKLSSSTCHPKEPATTNAKADTTKSDSVAKSSRKSKTKKNGERKDDRTLNRDNRTNSCNEHLTNSLIYELDD